MNDSGTLSRRRLLAATALALTAGCQSEESAPEPVTLSGDENCDQCGMVIGQHPGPAGETYYEDERPTGHDPPARFCSAVCTYRHRFENEPQGWTPDVTYLTDYSSVDYEVTEDAGPTVVSRHLDAAAFAETTGLTVVVGTDVQGAMGPALVPFGDESDATAFADEYGGQTVAATDLTREAVERQ